MKIAATESDLEVEELRQRTADRRYEQHDCLRERDLWAPGQWTKLRLERPQRSFVEQVRSRLHRERLLALRDESKCRRPEQRFASLDGGAEED